MGGEIGSLRAGRRADVVDLDAIRSTRARFPRCDDRTACSSLLVTANQLRDR
jgi:hypothetical protein